MSKVVLMVTPWKWPSYCSRMASRRLMQSRMVLGAKKGGWRYRSPCYRLLFTLAEGKRLKLPKSLGLMELFNKVETKRLFHLWNPPMEKSKLHPSMSMHRQTPSPSWKLGQGHRLLIQTTQIWNHHLLQLPQSQGHERLKSFELIILFCIEKTTILSSGCC